MDPTLSDRRHRYRIRAGKAKAALYARVFENKRYTMRQIADELGVSMTTADTRVKRGPYPLTWESLRMARLPPQPQGTAGMSNDIKTLENAQPGERVRLGDQAERVRFEARGRAEGLPLARGNFGGYAFEVMAKAWRTWQFLSTQPSPGGQGDAVHCGKCKGGGYVDVDVDVDESGRSIGNIEACPQCTLAARQPLGEPVAISKDARECLQETIDNCWRDEDQAVASEIDRLMRGPLYTAPTAQTVDLGPVRVLADHAAGRINHANNGLCPDEVEGQNTRDPDCPVCRALIDSQAVSNG